MRKLALVILVWSALPCLAGTTYHVSPSGSHTPPFSDWASAATNIQAAVDEAVDGDTVLVSDGNFPSSVTAWEQILIQSANGPDLTVIDGDDERTCVHLYSACELRGFTITRGRCPYIPHEWNIAGGIACSTDAVVRGCIITNNKAIHEGGGMHGGTAINCTFIDNIVADGDGCSGAGMYGGTAIGCRFEGNSALYGGYGGGMSSGISSNCLFINNTASSYGGGKYGGVAYDCTFYNNEAIGGGGMFGGDAQNCIFRENFSYDGGGAGMNDGTAVNCLFYDNKATGQGGGMSDCIAMNCTIVSNITSMGIAGGLEGCVAYNCIVWRNFASDEGDNLLSTTAYNTCSPDVAHGVGGNITNAPAFVDPNNGDYRLLATSPCTIGYFASCCIK